MKKTINRRILAGFSMLLFSCFLFGGAAYADDRQSITVYSNIYNAANVINARFEYEISASTTNAPGVVNEPSGFFITFDNVVPEQNIMTRTAEVSFRDTIFPVPGIYRYEIKEVSSSNSDYAVSDEKYEIYVIATNSGKNVYHLARNLLDDTKGLINFNHNPERSFAVISVETVGDAVDKNQYFRFKLEIDSLCQGCKYDIVGQDEYINYGGQLIQTSDFYTAGAGATYIYLKNGQTVTIGLKNGLGQIPLGTKIKVVGDDNLNTRKWSMVIDGEYASSADFLVNQRLLIEIVMERNLSVPNTGIFGELWPFTFLVMLGAIGCGWLVFIGKKSDDSEYEE